MFIMIINITISIPRRGDDAINSCSDQEFRLFVLTTADPMKKERKKDITKK